MLRQMIRLQCAICENAIVKGIMRVYLNIGRRQLNWEMPTDNFYCKGEGLEKDEEKEIYHLEEAAQGKVFFSDVLSGSMVIWRDQ